MILRLVKLAFNLAVITIGTTACHATSHAFVKDKNGVVWIVSDTLKTHYDDYGKETRSTACKVVLQRGRVIVNAGLFKSVDLLQTDETLLPVGNIDATVKSVVLLLKKYSWLPEGSPIDPNIGGQSAAIIQVEDGVFLTRMITLSTDLHHYVVRDIRTPFLAGIPHGYGELVEKERLAATIDPVLRKQISGHPKSALLRILKGESKLPSEAVGPPYTVFVLRKDGSVSDYSEKHVCYVPVNVRHRDTQSNSNHTK